MSNELFVGFATETRHEPFRRFGFLPSNPSQSLKRR